MTKVLLILLVALVLEAMGVVLLSRGLKEVGGLERATWSGVVRLAGRGLTNRYLLLGTAFEAAFFAGLLYLLSQRDVSLIWPLTSLGFVITAVAARIFLGEDVSWLRWCGVVLIVAGAALVSLSETQKTSAGLRSAPEVQRDPGVRGG